MSKIDDMIAGLADFSARIGEYAAEVLVDSSGDILEQVKVQLLSGIGGSGEALEPSYEDDPFFGGDEERARRYMRWKEHLNGYKTPERGVNLYINGAFHDSMYVEVLDGGVKVTSPMEEKIMEKWGVENFAPTDDWMEDNVMEVMRWTLNTRLREALNI